jgi:hypothetical protein
MSHLGAWVVREWAQPRVLLLFCGGFRTPWVDMHRILTDLQLPPLPGWYQTGFVGQERSFPIRSRASACGERTFEARRLTACR